MDMSNSVSPAILPAFYRLVLEGGILSAVLALPLVIFTRRGGRFLLQTRAVAKPSDMRVPMWLARLFGILWILDGLLQAQPDMGSQLLPGVIDPMISSLPDPLQHALSPALYLWSLHPLLFDAAAVWAQIVIGTAICLGPGRPLGRLGLYVSIGWALVIWVFGEAFGGLLAGATWLTGAPGSALLYAFAAAILLQPAASLANGQARRWIGDAVATLWMLAAFLQAWPPSGFWQPGGLQGAILPMAQMNQPAWLSAPIYMAAHLFTQRPALLNGMLVAILVLLSGAWFLRPNLRGLSAGTIAFAGLTWWIGQDFGVFGGLGTDPNTGAPLLLLLFAHRFLAHGTPQEAAPARTGATPTPAGAMTEHKKDRLVVRPLWATVGITTAVMLTIGATGQFAEDADAARIMLPALDQAGLTPVNLPLPDLTLENQLGRPVSLSSFRGKAVLLTFLDPVCYSDCPIIASEMAAADRLLGTNAGRVQMVAICANPIFHSVTDLQRFDAQEGLNRLANWTYLTSPNVGTLKRAWHDFFEYVKVVKLGMVDHADQLYFISPAGREVWLADGSDDLRLGVSYSTFMAAYMNKLLHAGQPLPGVATPDPGRYHPGIVHPAGWDLTDMVTAQTGWALRTVEGYEEVLWTGNDRRNWRPVTPAGISQSGGLLLDAVSGKTAWVLVPPHGYDQNAALFYTADSGGRWTVEGAPGPTPAFYGQNAFAVSAPGHLWLTGASGPAKKIWLYRSRDGGMHWTHVALPLSVSGVQQTVTKPIIWSSAADGSLSVQLQRGDRTSTERFATRDGGNAWTLIR